MSVPAAGPRSVLHFTGRCPMAVGAPFVAAGLLAGVFAAPDAAWATPPEPIQDLECYTAGMDLEDRASPLDSATVEVNGEVVKVCYGAPSARGRTMIGGEEVPYGEPWRLGANEATALHLPFPARLGDVELEPGSYSLYAIPGAEEWTVVANAEVERWGIPIDAEVRAQDVGELQVPRERPDEHVETLSLSFREVGDAEAELVMEWEEYRIAIPLQWAEFEEYSDSRPEAGGASRGPEGRR